MKSKIVNGYKFIKVLGEGTYGRTWLGTKLGVKLGSKLETNKRVAIKIIKTDKDRHYKAEIDGLKQILPQCQPYTVCLLDHFKEDGKMYIVMNYVSGKNLSDLILSSSLDSRQSSKKIYRDLKAGLKIMHKLNLAHQDIKTTNVMFDGSYYKYVDFGLACPFNDPLPYPCEAIGTRYAAPLDVVESKTRMTFEQIKAHDVWSLGVLLLRWYTINKKNYYKDLMMIYTGVQEWVFGDLYKPKYYGFPKMMLDEEIDKTPEFIKTVLFVYLDRKYQNRKL